MYYATYFKTNQKVQLLSDSKAESQPRFEAITGIIVKCARDFFDLAVPYDLDSDGVPLFTPGMNFTLLSESFGLGVRLTVHFLKSDQRHLIRICPHEDMEVFSSRQYLRADLTVNFNLARMIGPLRSCRGRWVAAVRAIERDQGATVRPYLRKAEINLSAGGMRVAMKHTAQVAELYLAVIDLDADKLPLCALCEIAWINTATHPDVRSAGLRFINIIQADRQRLDRHVGDKLKEQGLDVNYFQTRQELLDRMTF